MERIGRWDVAAAARVDHYIAISEFSRQRIADIYGREASVLHPPVEVHRFQPGEPEDFFLVVAEMVRHKRVELALEAARRAGKRVKVVGAGPDLARLTARYGDTAEFLGRVPDDQLNELYSRAQALIVPNVEEFGITLVEAQAAGRPVVAADGGGAQEIVVPDQNGVLVPPGDVDALAEALRETDFERFDKTELVANAGRFSPEAFCERLTAEVEPGAPGARLTDKGAQPTRPLLIGGEAFPDTPGGLNRFLHDLFGLLAEAGEEPRAVLVGPAATPYRAFGWSSPGSLSRPTLAVSTGAEPGGARGRASWTPTSRSTPRCRWCRAPAEGARWSCTSTARGPRKARPWASDRARLLAKRRIDDRFTGARIWWWCSPRRSGGCSWSATACRRGGCGWCRRPWTWIASGRATAPPPAPRSACPAMAPWRLR